ncbi:MAG: AmmeMemoRadiSam system protein A [Syntrophomonadaceae bacterium]|nr:AmmeMemoRadiSam system protein A [Syntrophomonadaceae bacterium]MDD3889142.1 AmmeMemoRadiSam system protein A [Syntrophomonadaceae bacterium]MDD4549679.1 AmmeMemoRadiSam system protein A [Syntrophomonadaceae bacterium]
MITYAALSPHPPIIVPYIGGERLKDCEQTVKGIKQMARELLATSPDTIVFLTPHGNVFADCISYLSDPVLEGDFSNFGSRVEGTSMSNDIALLAEIEKQARRSALNFIGLDRATAREHHLNPHLDHGILVPLHYLQEAGMGSIDIAAISIGYLSILELYTLGRLISGAAEQLGKKVAIVASGDMSHRLKDEGPYDYHPDGPRFDATVKELIAAGDAVSILNIPEDLRDNAGECGYRSIVIMLGALDGKAFKATVFSYEGPFGVGYLIAGFIPGKKNDSLLEKLQQIKKSEMEQNRREESLPVKWARRILEDYVKTGKLPELPLEMAELKEQKAGAFVSLKKNGQLRGCIGTIMPAYGDLSEEIAGNAVSAGTRDPRFAPVTENELNELVYSVDIMGEPEPCTLEDLDPCKYGVIVSRGNRRGLLLPDLEGVDTVDEQISIALQKAGISPGEKYSLERFEVTRYK